MDREDVIVGVSFVGLFSALIIGIFGTLFIVVFEEKTIDKESFCNEKGLLYSRSWCYELDGDIRTKLFEVKYKCIDKTKWLFSVCGEWEYWGERDE